MDGSPEAGLLEAGAVLPLAGGGTGGGTDSGSGRGSGSGTGSGAATDELTARAYRHAALDDRTVVRLVPGTIAPAEDLALEYLGFEGAGADSVGRVRPQSLGFPAWALVHDPARGHHALAVVKEMERLGRQVSTKPGLAKEGFDEIGVRLDRSVPQFLPTYYEQVGRLFLAVEGRQQASVFFGKARAAEQRHALPVDESRLREVFLEFAGAGALSGKALREYAKGLAARLSPAEAYAEFRVISAQRCAAGLTPYAGMLEDLRRLARAADLDAAAEERSLLSEIIHTGAMSRASGTFWKSALGALSELAAGDPAVRERLLSLLPDVGGDSTEEFDGEWLALLERCGAFSLLLDGTVPAAEWLTRWSRHRHRGWRALKRLESELALVERLADRLVADGTPVKLLRGGGNRCTADLDVLDLCLALGIPVYPPGDEMERLDLGNWLGDERAGGRDLAALVADPRFTRMLRGGVEQLAGSPGEPSAALTKAAGHPELCRVVAGWLTDRADDLERPAGFPELDALLKRIRAFSAPVVLATAPEAVDRIAEFSPVGALARTLSTGILDELGWPAFEEAMAEMTLPASAPAAGRSRTRGRGGDDSPELADAWPVLVVRQGMLAVAAGPEGVVDRHTISLPAKQTYSWETPLVRWIGGQWLTISGSGTDQRGRWSGRQSEVFTPDGRPGSHWLAYQTPSLELPDGGRTFGGRPVHPGDTSFASEHRAVASDGVSVWVLHDQEWWDYDPESARRGRVSMPGFFDSALAERSGSTLLNRFCRLLPVRAGLEDSPFGSANGVVGWWVRFDPQTRTLTACSVDGTRSPAVKARSRRPGQLTEGIPLPPLRLPAGGVLHPREDRGHQSRIDLHDAEGVCLASLTEGGLPGTYAAGTAMVVPVGYWHAFRPRDERGSAALRAVTEESALALLEAGVVAVTEAVRTGTADSIESADLTGAVREVLPEVTHPGLLAGVTGFVREAVRVASTIARIRKQGAGGAASADSGPQVRHAHDGTVRHALNTLINTGYFYGNEGPGSGTGMMDQLWGVRDALACSADESRVWHSTHGRDRLHLVGDGLAAAAMVAVSPVTDRKHRDAVLEYLEAALEVRADGEAVLIDPRGRLRTVDLTGECGGEPQRMSGTVRHSGARRLLVQRCYERDNGLAVWKCLEYDPAGVFGAWDGLTETESEVHGRPDDPARADTVRRLIETARERGPLPYRPEQAVEFGERVGVGAAVAALVQLGLPEINEWGRDGLLTAEYLAPLGLKTPDAKAARSALSDFTLGERHRYTSLLLPSAPELVAGLWERGFDLEPLAGSWLAERGKRRVAPSWLVARVVTEVGSGTLLDSALNPEAQPELTGRTVQSLDKDGDLAAAEPSKLLTMSELGEYVEALRWLAYRLPFGDPLRAVLPVTLRMLRERLADPALLLDPGVDWDDKGKPTSVRVREAYGLAPRVKDGREGLVEAGQALVLAPMSYRAEWDSIWIGAAAVTAGEVPCADHPDVKLLVAIGRESHGLEALFTVMSEEFTALVSADGPAGAPQCPAHSVPELVTAAAGRFGLSEDAAALYLMLLALPDPTDRNQAAWTGWKPARLKRARTELAATELVVEAKRARAGRSLFLPGGWAENSAPRLPWETWKQDLLPWGGHGSAIPDRPVADVFALAWQRVVDGDAPGFEEFRGRTARGARGGSR
ncbi:hypothetical protein [Streptomyces sp. CAU 1734]|uniref:hypothetical protein n=1 Tax=Streptomyces sp. CAU 1734 TaxID=3140360 RepID=UPI00326148CA